MNFIRAFLVFITLLVHSFALNQDGTLLLSFKYSVLSDPLSVLDNWNYDDLSPCSWTGVTCAQIEPVIDPNDMFRLISLVLPNYQLLGSIPEELGLIQHLHTLDLSNNFLNGTLPISLFNSSELQVLSLAGNVISGELPELISGVKLPLQLLNLSDNALAGEFPQVFTSLQNLSVVSLRSNYFSGSVPSDFRFVQVLDLSSNLFNGTLSNEFGGENLRYLNLSYNKLSGSVSPEFVKKVPVNSTIDLSFNNLTGPIPQSVALLNQKTESFVGNADLCGKPLKKLCIVPSTLSSPPNVTAINGSSSPAAIAAIPKTIDSTPGQISPGAESTTENQPEHGLKPGTIAGIAVGDLAGIGLLAMVILYVYQLKKKNRDTIAKSTSETKEYTVKTEPTISKEVRGLPTWSCLIAGESSEATGSDTDENSSKNGAVEAVNEEYNKKQRSLVMVDGETELEIETLLKASAYVLGSSGGSIVYKAVLADGTVFAVRRIGEIDGGGRVKEFEGTVRVIDKMRHPNLVRVRGFYWGDAEKLVIYDYVSNGSLAGAGGYKRIGSSPCRLSFETRLKIARGVARGLTYIHEKKHVHGNIKPTNILLTPDLEPVISDFGLHWLISSKHCNRTDGPTRHFGSKRSISYHDEIHDLPTGPTPSTFTGCTSPYHAPESLKNLKPNPKWDVYSFGIIFLELLTGKVFSDRELGQWTAGGWSVEEKNRVLRMADVAIRGDVDAREDAALECFMLGFSCASLIPQKRPSMKDVLQVLEKMTCS